MLLREIKSLIMRRGEVCQSEVYSAIDADRGLIDQAVSELLAKGIIKEITNNGICKGCPAGCKIQTERLFRIC
jgi:predicted transcriptional regulator